jgi:hypothetical protein
MISGINTILSANTALTTEIGDDKIYPVVVPQGTEPPFIATSLASDSSEAIKNSADRTGFPSVNVNLHTENYDDLESISELIKDALNGQSGSQAGTTFQKIWCVNAYDRPDLYNNPFPYYARTLVFNTIIKRT